MITLNQYLKIIQNFLKKHKQINTVLTGDDYDFNQYPSIIYPVANVEYVRQNMSSVQTIDTFEITIADLFDPNLKKSEYKIYSDCNQVADDFITYFDNLIDIDFDIDTNIQVQSWKGNVDGLAGVVFSVNFTQFREGNACIIPMDDALAES